jgi:5-oxopent-3-ene-1,2,5-tricarboxylate decarboxylase/2-hydroxyhepta-2,4-diene-1,7-dioate isomerase
MHTAATAAPHVGTVFAAALNHLSQREQMADAFNEAPYQKPPQRGVWFIKTPNTVCASGDAVGVPAFADEISVGPTLAVQIGSQLRRASAQDAMNAIAGYRLANELSLIEDSVYRPPVVAKCRDGFCPLGELLPAAKLPEADEIEIDCRINGQLVQTLNLADLHRSISELLADLCEYATLNAGDIVLVGCAEPRPRARVGDTIRIESAGMPALETTLVAEDAA